MNKRIIAVLLVILPLFTVVGCGTNFIENIKLQNEETQKEETACNIYIYKTTVTEEYISFLENFDESNNEILGVTTSMYTGPYTSLWFYMVTYKKLDKPRKIKKTGKVSLFKTTDKDMYCNFLTDFDETHYEIIGTTTSMWTGPYTDGEFYMVTYRELN